MSTLQDVLTQVPIADLTNELRRRKKLAHGEHWDFVCRAAAAFCIDPADVWIDNTKVCAICDARIAIIAALREQGKTWLTIGALFGFKCKEHTKYFHKRHQERMQDPDYAQRFMRAIAGVDLSGWTRTADRLPGDLDRQTQVQTQVLMWSPGWATYFSGLCTHRADGTCTWGLYDQEADRYYHWDYPPEFWMEITLPNTMGADALPGGSQDIGFPAAASAPAPSPTP